MPWKSQHCLHRSPLRPLARPSRTSSKLARSRRPGWDAHRLSLERPRTPPAWCSQRYRHPPSVDVRQTKTGSIRRAVIEARQTSRLKSAVIDGRMQIMTNMKHGDLGICTGLRYNECSIPGTERRKKNSTGTLEHPPPASFALHFLQTLVLRVQGSSQYSTASNFYLVCTSTL